MASVERWAAHLRKAAQLVMWILAARLVVCPILGAVGAIAATTAVLAVALFGHLLGSRW
jgi:hypothetical protein